MPRALIIGGGVAGPAAAQLLARDGWDAHVYEAHAEPDPYAGLFLNVATNGLAVLETLGLRDRLLTDGHRAGRMVMWSRTGKELGTVPNGPAREPERGSVIVRRSWLHQVLREGSDAAGVPTTYGARLVSIDQDAHGVRATFADGTVAEGDLLVGADGIGSPTRRHIDPDAPEPDVQRARRGRRLRAGARPGADARDPALRLRRPLVLRLPRARRRHHLLVRQRHGTRPGRDRDAGRPARAALRRPVPRPADPRGDHRRAPSVPDRRPRRGAAVEPRAGRRPRGRRARHQPERRAGGVARAGGRGRPGRALPRAVDRSPTRSPPTSPHASRAPTPS